MLYLPPSLCAADADGTAWTCGKLNKNGVLGRGTDAALPPAAVTLTGAADTTKVVAAVCGDAHTLLLTSTGEVYAFGDNASGQLGLGAATATANTPTVRAPSVASSTVSTFSAVLR